MAEVPNGQGGIMLCISHCLGAPWMCQGNLRPFDLKILLHQTLLGSLGHIISGRDHLPTPRQQLRILFSCCTPKTWG